MSSINGVIVPSITFYNNNFEINTQLNLVLFRHIILNGANAILLFNSYKEQNFPDVYDQQIKFIKNAYNVTGKKFPVIFGVDGDELDNIIDQIEDLGKKFNKLNFIISPQVSEKMSSSELRTNFENILSSLTLDNPVFLYNNPIQFAGNEIEPKILSKLIEFPNLKGIIDASDKISLYKAYINLINDNFSVFCSNVAKFSTFLQLIPKEFRINSGIVSSMGNLVNICANLFKAALEDNVLEIIQMQELLEDIRDKIYFKFEKGQRFQGLRYAFLYLYKDLLSITLDNFQKDLDSTSIDIIEATVNYLINQKYIYQLYSLNKEEVYRLDEIINLFSDIPILSEQGKIKKIIGPFVSKINTIYRVKFEDSQYIFRFRTSKSFKYENILKEKLLYHFLAGNSPSFYKKIEEIIKTQIGIHFFDKQKPPIVPVANLIYYDETKKRVPYLFTIMDYIHGKPLYRLIEQYLKENRSITTKKFINLFNDIGEMLAKLHEIKFESFYEKITDIGTKKKKNWPEIFSAELEAEIQEAKKYNMEFTEAITDYLSENAMLIEEENEPILLHNDYQGNNVIVKDESKTIRINGLIDFDDWRIGVRALDFVKMDYWMLNYLKKPQLNDSFKQGYMNYNNYKIDNEFNKKVEIYSLFWFLKMYNMKFEKIKKIEKEKESELELISAETYLNEIKKILNL
ncbi:MAG: dihydrodipicolinate synthase family protein [Candidatus Hodarchaeota archaeon]